VFLPIGDEPNPRGRPWVTWLLITLNVGAYLLWTVQLSMQPPRLDDPRLRAYLELMQSVAGQRVPLRELLAQITAYDLFAFDHGFKPSAPALDDVLTAMFLHGGLMHLAGNMLFLWIFGDNVEAALGRVKFLLAYLVTGVAGTMLHVVFFPDSMAPVLGASGAISGVLGFYFLLFPMNRVKVAAFLFPFHVGVLRLPSRWVLGFYLVVDNMLPFLVTRGAGGVAHGAHIGGFVAGWVLARFWSLKEAGGLLATSRQLHNLPGLLPIHHGEGSPPQVIHQLVQDGDLDQATGEYAAAFATHWRRAVAPSDALHIADHLRGRGELDAALGIYQAVLHDDPRGPYAARAHVAAGEMLLTDLDRPSSAWQHFAKALDLHPGGDLERQSQDALTAIQRMQRAAGLS